MKTWIFMLLVDLLIPAVMVFFGLIYRNDYMLCSDSGYAFAMYTD